MNGVDRLEALRPTKDSVDRLWSPAERQAVLEGVLHPARRTGRVRRPLMLVGAAASVAVAALAVSLVLPGGAPGGASPAAAAALDRLAGVAAAAPFDTARPDQFLHMVVVETQTGDGSAAENPAGTSVRTHESWTAADGSGWRKDTEAGHVLYFRLPAGGDYTAAPSPAYLASLPTDPDALRARLVANASGSTSTDEAVFVAVGDMLRGGFAPPALRVAALEALKHTPHVSLGKTTVDAQGRPVVELDFVDQGNRPDEVQALYFSAETSEIVQETTQAPGLDYRGLVQASGVTDAVPADVLAQAVAPYGAKAASNG
jgi:hypothetical protein